MIPVAHCPTCRCEVRETAAAAPTLFDPPLTNPAAPGVTLGATTTSAQAALRAYPRSGTQREAVLRLIATFGPITDDDIQAVLGMSPNTERPRRRELVLGGWVEASGETHKLGTTGNEAIAWRLTEEGRRSMAAR